MSITLEELVGQEDVSIFIREHVLGGRHHVSSAPELAARIREVPGLSSTEELLGRLEHVWVFGNDGQRQLVSAIEAPQYYEQGCAIYAENIGDVIPQLSAMTRRLCGQLGIHPQWMGFEAFAARAGAVSTLHYDHESNFQILLQGRKRWRLAANRCIENPRLAHHRLENPLEEAQAHTLPFPKSLEEAKVARVNEGSVVFFPLGYWHEVESETDTLAVNLVVKPPRICESLGEALSQRLARSPRMREPTTGLVGSDVSEGLTEHAQALLREAKEALHEAADALSLRDLGLVFDNLSLRWSEASSGRRLQVEGGRGVLHCTSAGRPSLDALSLPQSEVALFRALLPFQGSFTLEQLRGLAPELSAEHLLVTMLQMRARGYWVNNLEQ